MSLPDSFWQDLKGENGSMRQMHAIALAKSFLNNPNLSALDRSSIQSFLRRFQAI